MLQKMVWNLHTHTNHAVMYPYRKCISLPQTSVADLWLHRILPQVLCPFQLNVQTAYLKVFSSQVWLKTSDGSVPNTFEVPGFCHSVPSFGIFFFLPTPPPHTPVCEVTHIVIWFHLQLHVSAEILMSFWQCNIWVLNEDANIFWETYWSSLFFACSHTDHTVTKVKGHLWTTSAVFHHKKKSK